MKFFVSSFCILINILICVFATNKLVNAQSIQTDGTTSTQPENCSGNCSIEGGLQRGDNLFHSFEKFNVDAGAAVLFRDSGVANILSRVTGNEPSKILGTLGVSNGEANLFLINPNGIIFGQNSSLDLNGSFLATTANAIRFGEQGLLNTIPNEIPLLTIEPSALFFSARDRGTIISESSPSAGDNPINLETFGLRVSDGKSLLLVGGDVIINSGSVTAFGGRVELGGLAKAGEIALNITNVDRSNIHLSFPEQDERANVFLTNSTFINVFSKNGGDIAVNAKNITISENSSLVAGILGDSITSNSQAGNITLNAIDKIEVINNSAVSNQVSTLETKGNAGNIYINSDSLFLINGSRITAATLGQGNAGNVNIILEGNFVASNSDILSEIGSGAIGDAGNINIEANNLSLNSGSQLVSNVQPAQNDRTGGRGDGGTISLNVVNLVNIVGFNTDGFSSGIVTATESGAEGQGGNITVNTDSFQIADGAIVSSQTINQSNGGNISIDANSFTAINGGQIVTSTANSGNAGNINIQVSDSLLISGSDFNFANRLTKFGDEIVGNEAPGNSGLFANVRLEASGVGGNIDVAAGQLNIQDGAEINVSAAGTGEAGSLSIDAKEVTLARGNITAETRVGDEGNITLNNADTLLLRNNSQLTTNATESATGGDITISSDGIALLNNSNIAANAVRGQGGNIKIITQGIFQEPDSEITAASEFGIDGTITINSLDIDPSSGIFELPNIPIDAEAILAQDLCKFEDEKIAKGSSFIITGRGGLTPTSEDTLDNVDNVVGWANREDIEVSENGTVGVRQRSQAITEETNYPIVQQSQGWVKTSDGSVWLVANSPKTTPQDAKLIHPDCGSLPQ